jgi:hypothetical protein
MGGRQCESTVSDGTHDPTEPSFVCSCANHLAATLFGIIRLVVIPEFVRLERQTGHIEIVMPSAVTVRAETSSNEPYIRRNV